MDFTFTKNQPVKTFVRYSVKGVEINEKVITTHARNGFYYVGKNAETIEKLVKVFKRGYASENTEAVKHELLRGLSGEKNYVPEVIFCESSFEAASIRNLSQFLFEHEIFSSIPFVVTTSDLADPKVNFVRKNKLADDVILIQSTDENTILNKVQFLKKIKSAPAKTKEPAESAEHKFSGFNFGIFLKRMIDAVVSLLALILLSPLFGIIALAIYLESKGPIFYTSKRAGRGYKIFNFYKFRTMQVDAEQKMVSFSHLNQYNANEIAPIFFKISNDPRITRVGSFLRNTSLDELPQLINVLLGDMSLVGNRPLPLYEAASLTTDQYAQRFLAPAGITGLWQIKKRGKENMSAEERINLDIDYANNNSFVYDLWIMVNTPSALMQKEKV